MNAVILIPSLNPNEQLKNVIQGCMDRGLNNVIVVNDGSAETYDAIFAEAESLGARVLRHEKNLGKGAALRTGIGQVSQLFPDAGSIVTADADGQHSSDDILRVAEAIEAQADGIVLGSRSFSKDTTPLRSRFGNSISAFLFLLMTGMHCTDTQTGLRGIAKTQFDLALRVPGERYDYEMNFLVEAARKKLPISFVPIQTIYFENNSGSHFRAVRDSALIYQRPLKYAAVAISSSVLDLGCFAALSSLVFAPSMKGIFAATAIARCISGVYNFRMNQVWCFNPKKRTIAQFGKYLVLFLSCIIVSSLLVNILKFLPISLTIVKALVDIFIFFINYQVQKRWVFADK